MNYSSITQSRWLKFISTLNTWRWLSRIFQFQLLASILSCFLISASFAQDQANVRGTVTDPDGEPLIGVTILEQGTSNGTLTDLDGRYSINLVGSDPTLVYNYAGFKPVRERVSGRSQINVKMDPDTKELGEMVVTALGFKEDKDKLGYANSKIDADRVAAAGEATLLSGMAGRASGVNVSRSSGDPGAGSFIQIRGLSTINGSNPQPLIILDGVPINNDAVGDGQQRGVVQQSRLNDINPDDIEDISVLKGASAAALWGTRAIGGVIYITTKSGKYNQKMNVTYKSTYSVDQVNARYPIQRRFGQGTNGAWSPFTPVSWGDRISDRPGGPDEFDTSGAFFEALDGTRYYPITSKNSRDIFIDSNFDDVIQNGHFFENSLNLSGGGENGRYFFSISDLNQEGVIRNNSDYRRSTVRFNAEQNLTNNFQLNTSSTYTRTTSNRILKGANASGLYLGLLRTPPDFDNRNHIGDYYADPNATPIAFRHRSYRNSIGQDFNPGFNNPGWTINEQEDQALVDRFVTTVKATYNPTNWLDLIARAGIDHFSEERQEFFTPGSARAEFINGYFSRSILTNTMVNVDLMAKATKDFNENFSGNLLVGFNLNHQKRVLSSNAINVFSQFTRVVDPVRDIGNSTPENTTVQSIFGNERTAGVYTSAQLSAYNMFFFNGTVRVESASTFGVNPENTFIFPSASLAWQFTQLPVFENSPINFGKLRFSYGEVGVQPERYRTTDNFVSPTYNDEFGGGLSTQLFGNGVFVPSVQVGNVQLRPERKKEFEVGTDLRFLDNRVSFSGTYFNNRTEDALLRFPIANSRGYRQIFDNAALIENQGFEIDLGYHLIRKQDFNVNIDLIFTRIRNMVLDLVGVESVDMGGTAQISGRAVEGQPLGVFWGGRYRREEDGSLSLNANGFPRLDPENGVIGDPNPDWQGSLILALNYKKFSLNLLVETYQGADIVAATKGIMVGYGLDELTANEVTATSNLVDYNGNVVPIGTTFRGNIGNFGGGDVALNEAYYRSIGDWFGGLHEQYVEDGSWTRIRELTLGYTLNTPGFKELTKLSSVHFALTGRNLFIWTKFQGNDPDTNLTGATIARGIDYFNNPGTRSFIASITVNF